MRCMQAKSRRGSCIVCNRLAHWIRLVCIIQHSVTLVQRGRYGISEVKYSGIWPRRKDVLPNDNDVHVVVHRKMRFRWDLDEIWEMRF